MNESKRTFLASLGAGLAAAAVLSKSDSAVAADKEESIVKKKHPKTPGLDQAVLATALAMEANQRKSPILMLAAIELVANLKESNRANKAKIKTEGDAGKTGKKALSVQVGDWVDSARAYAKEDKELSEFLEKRLEKLTSRGLAYRTAAGKPEVTIPGAGTFKVLHRGVLGPGQVMTGTNIYFNANEPAVVASVSDGDGYLGLGAFDGPISLGKDAEPGKVKLVRWYPSVAQNVTVKLVNVGSAATSYVLLANW